MSEKKQRGKIILDGIELFEFIQPFAIWRGEKYLEFGTIEDLTAGFPTYRLKEYQLSELQKQGRLIYELTD